MCWCEWDVAECVFWAQKGGEGEEDVDYEEEADGGVDVGCVWEIVD